jgi:putative transcriptional regulator
MPIAVDIDVMMARRKMSVGELADRIGITPANLAVLKNGRAKAVRFTTLAALCEALGCQPGDLLRWEPEDAAGDDVPQGDGSSLGGQQGHATCYPHRNPPETR